LVCVNFEDLEIDLFEKLHLIRNKNAKNSDNKTLAITGII